MPSDRSRLVEDVHTTDCDEPLSRKIIDISSISYKLYKWILAVCSTLWPWWITVVSLPRPRPPSSHNRPSHWPSRSWRPSSARSSSTGSGGRSSSPRPALPSSGPARQVLRDLETGRAAVTAVSGLESGVLSLACLPTLAADPTAALVGRFRSHHPGVRVDLAAPEDTRELFELVETGTCELGLTDALDVPDTLVSTGLGSQVLVFILPPGRLQRHRGGRR